MVVRPVLCRPLIGRSDELAYLHERRLAAAQSHGGLVLIVGNAGIGKSRLVSEFCGTLAHSRWRIGHGACLEHLQRPYGPLLEILAALDSSSAALEPAVTKREQLDLIVDRIGHVAEKTGFVAIVEDLHWADTATLELLTFLAPKLERMRALVLVTSRAQPSCVDDPFVAALDRLDRAARSSRVRLGPLESFELRRFIDEALIGHILPGETRRSIARTSEGNPFFAEELLRVAVEPASGESIGDAALPSSISGILLAHARLLNDDDRRIVSQAAVIGRRFDVTLLAQTLGVNVEAVLPALQRARAVQLVEEEAPESFRFRHALTRESLYGEFLGAQVRPLHRAIAAALESAPQERRALEDLAYHWWAAGDAERAARYNERAGDAAGSVHGHDDAIAFYERALESSKPGSHECGLLLEKIAERYGVLNIADRAHAKYEAAAQCFGRDEDREDEARCRVRAAIAAYMIGLPNPTGPLVALLGRLQSDAFIARSRIHLGIAWLTASFWYPTEAAHHLAQIDERAIREHADIAARYHNVACWVAMTLGDVETFAREHAAWVDAARRAGSLGAVASAHFNGAPCFTLFGLHEEARAQIERALEIARAERSRHAEDAAHAVESFCYLMSGDLQRARAAIEAVATTRDKTAVSLAHAAAWGTLVGEHLDDRALIETWFDGARALLAPPETDYAAGYAAVLIRRGRPQEAQALLHRALVDCERQRGNVLTLLATARYGATDDLSRAREQIAAAADSPTELVERHALALFDAYVAHRDGRQAMARAAAAAAAEGFARLRFPLLEAAAREQAGETDAAIAIYHRCGAVGDVRRLLRAAPVLRGPDAALPSTSSLVSGPALSQREREISILVARGNSNLEIARSLAISHKTVEKHLGSVFAKLGFSSRAQLAAHVGAAPVVDA